MNQERTEASVKRALVYSALALVFAGLTAVVVIWLQSRETESIGQVDDTTHVPAIETEIVSIPDFAFTDVTREAGINFVHTNGAYGERLLPETMGGGVAFFDFNRDGWQDLFFVNSSDWPWQTDQGSDNASR